MGKKKKERLQTTLFSFLEKQSIMKVEAKMAKQRTEKIKNILKFLGQEFIYGGHLISFGAASIVVSGAIILGIQLSWPPLVVAYLMTFTALLYNRQQEQDIASPSHYLDRA